jgi:hypothetical protein
VIENPDRIDELLKFSKGQRKVPVIVDQGEVTIGFEGKT